MDYKFDNKCFSPDFYLVAPHGTGALSISYYLSLIGVPVTQHKGLYIDGKKSPINYPIQKSEYIYARGISCDRALLDLHPLTYGDKKQKVIQLLRDPIDQLTSLINWFVYDSIQPTGSCCEIFDNNSKIKLINSWLTLTVMSQSLRRSVNTKYKTLYIDFKDILPDECEKTIANICNYLNIPLNINQYITNKFKIPYNSFKNRCWAYSTKKAFTVSADIGIISVSVFPSQINDYFANYWNISHVIDVFEYNGVEYIVSIPEQQFYNRYDFFVMGLYKDYKRNAIKNSLDKFFSYNNIVEKLYKEQSMSWMDTLELIRSKPKFRSRFLKLMDYENSSLIKEVPDVVNSWVHFNSL